MLEALAATREAVRPAIAARNRLKASRERTDRWERVMNRRERTRQLIELDGLVAKAGLVPLTNDDRAVIFGLLVEDAAALRSEHSERALTLWRRPGKCAFEDEAED